MNDSIISALIAVGGVIVGGGVAFISQLIINKINNKRENRRITYQLKIDTYADAIRYIALCCKVHSHENASDYVAVSKSADALYDKFHPLFTIIAPEQVLIEYNSLRNDATAGRIEAKDAYLKVVSILDYNISGEIE